MTDVNFPSYWLISYMFQAFPAKSQLQVKVVFSVHCFAFFFNQWLRPPITEWHKKWIQSKWVRKNNPTLTSYWKYLKNGFNTHFTLALQRLWIYRQLVMVHVGTSKGFITLEWLWKWVWAWSCGLGGTKGLTAALASATLAFFRRVLQASRSRRRFSIRRRSFWSTHNTHSGSSYTELWATGANHGLAQLKHAILGRWTNGHRLPKTVCHTREKQPCWPLVVTVTFYRAWLLVGSKLWNSVF